MSDLHLVTGGAGFIGSNLVRYLLERGDRVRVLDDFSSGRAENLAELQDRIEILRGDINDPSVWPRAAEGVRWCLHLAAMPSVPSSVADPMGAHRTNAEGSLRVFLACRDVGVDRVVNFSTSAVYGESPVLPKEERMFLHPQSPYAASKLAAEGYARVVHANYGLPVVSLRPFNVYGPRQDPTSQYAAVVPIFIRRLREGQPPIIYGDGSQTRDFTYVDDLVRAVVLAAERCTAFGEVFNIASGRRISVNEMAARLREILGAGPEPTYEPARPGDVLHSHADTRRAAEAFGFRSEVSLEEGLRRTVDWFATG